MVVVSIVCAVLYRHGRIVNVELEYVLFQNQSNAIFNRLIESIDGVKANDSVGIDVISSNLTATVNEIMNETDSIVSTETLSVTVKDDDLYDDLDDDDLDDDDLDDDIDEVEALNNHKSQTEVIDIISDDVTVYLLSNNSIELKISSLNDAYAIITRSNQNDDNSILSIVLRRRIRPNNNEVSLIECEDNSTDKGELNDRTESVLQSSEDSLRLFATRILQVSCIL